MPSSRTKSRNTRSTTRQAGSGDSDLLSRSNLPDWIVQALKANRIRRLSQLAPLSDRQLLALSGIGQRASQHIRAALARQKAALPQAGSARPADDHGSATLAD
ncbi:hypothetical protein [Rhizobium sp. SSA_523]|uniref:hypothetical protein n=1 Tax=Rhizobium sp. SSA_523 TaxID=2952477 RepID=UPI0020919342|nr:hypothetical protein [Rhizobium sp. SSA_523]MCO5731917.1 hypothetical protein [Rhizobium sp. SSA_523]WKC22730.1 hypothetical protein QTJ18_17945 [Rhizobium sp. SSA_523]